MITLEEWQAENARLAEEDQLHHCVVCRGDVTLDAPGARPWVYAPPGLRRVHQDCYASPAAVLLRLGQAFLLLGQGISFFERPKAT